MTAPERLPSLAGPAEPPARLHGDLRNGNVLWGADGPARLIDPAAHGGHRETDLAMLDLFGCPHLDQVLDGCQDVAPLAAGREDRVGLHQLFPRLVREDGRADGTPRPHSEAVTEQLSGRVLFGRT